MKNIDRVREFHETYGQFINDKKSIEGFDKSIVFLRYKLITEEAGELIEAIMNNDSLEILDALTDLEYVIDGTYLTFGMDFDLSLETILERKDELSTTLTRVIDHMGLPLLMISAVILMVDGYLDKDLDVVEESLNNLTLVLDVMFDHYGFQDVREDAGVEVHRSNMSKLSEDGTPIYNENGKVMKGPNYFKPNLRQFINTQQNRTAQRIR